MDRNFDLFANGDPSTLPFPKYSIDERRTVADINIALLYCIIYKLNNLCCLCYKLCCNIAIQSIKNLPWNTKKLTAL